MRIAIREASCCGACREGRHLACDGDDCRCACALELDVKLLARRSEAGRAGGAPRNVGRPPRLQQPGDPPRPKGTNVAVAARHYDVLVRASLATGIPVRSFVTRALDQYIAQRLPGIVRAIGGPEPEPAHAESEMALHG